MHISGCHRTSITLALMSKRINQELINTLSEDDSLKDQNDSKHGTYHERQTIRKSADFLHHALFFLR